MNNYFKFLNESFDKMLNEAKQDEINFANIFGQELLNKFKTQKQKNRLVSPENDFYHWINKAHEDEAGTIEELTNLLNNLESRISRREREKIARNGAEVIYEDAEWIVLKINTYEAAKKYGAGSVWCITGRYPGHEDRGQHFFDDYKQRYGWDYYFYIKKDEEDLEGRQQKWCLCWDGEEGSDFQIWRGDQREQNEDEVSYIPGAPHVEGLPDVATGNDYEDETEDDDLDIDDDEEEAEEHPAPRRREQPFEIVRVEDPNSMEFPADSKEEAAQMFKDGAEIAATIREPNLFIVKWIEDGPVAENDNGERFALFVFFPGQGGGPLLAQTDANGGFGLQVFKNLEAARQVARQIPGMGDIHNNRDAHEDWPADLRENFWYYEMDELEPLEDEEEVELNVLDNNLTEGLEDWKELPTFQDVAKFGEGSQWIVAQPERNGEQYFKFYTNKGDVFVGKGEGETRVLALKKPDGTIYNMYDIHNKKVEK